MGHANNANNDIPDSANDDKRSEGSSHYSTASETSRTVSKEDGNNIGSGGKSNINFIFIYINKKSVLKSKLLFILHYKF